MTPSDRRRDVPRVLLLWPGGLFGQGRNFGVPQLLALAGAVHARTTARVDVVDLDAERAFGAVDLRKLLEPGYDLVGITCYSSYDYLKVLALGEAVKRVLPRAWLVTGGYHPSARPGDFTRPGSPFDYVVAGDGEGPLVRLVRALESGRRPLLPVVAPEAEAAADLRPYDWSLLDRYRPVARKVASQAEIYLSRGCPYDCSFCMERAKRDVSWRAFEPEEALEELRRLDAWLDLSRFTLFVADALFGMKRAWRRALLEGLARRPLRARKVWLLIRVDLVEREDLELMARANVAPGFGLESGDPGQLRLIRKAGKLDSYLEHMREVAGWARELDVPWGANVIVGHPGETEATLRTSARYLERLFLDDPRGTTGFLSVDPFRLYPGSPIDEDRAGWEARTGMRVHRYPWWEDGDQELLSEWVDPSEGLDYRTTQRLRRELLGPVLRAIPARFAYQGPSRPYFERAIREQIELVAPKRALHELGLFHLWSGLLGGASAEPAGALAADDELAATARARRAETTETIAASPRVRAALVEVPRERFVRADDVARASEDAPLALDDEGASTVSALHAYARSFELLGLAPGDRFLDLGAGRGYGVALAAHVVGAGGTARGVEIAPELVAHAGPALATLGLAAPRASVDVGDAHDVAAWGDADRVMVAFALRTIPDAFRAALRPGARLVAPVGEPGLQTLVRLERLAAPRGDLPAGALVEERFDAVRYVPDRHAASSQAATGSAASRPTAATREATRSGHGAAK